jgi:hypothetical protein
VLTASFTSGLDLLDQRYGNMVPNDWNMGKCDRVLIGDFNGDGRSDVVLYNACDWDHIFLGIFTTTSSGGIASRLRISDAVTGWKFSYWDQLYVANFNGDAYSDLVVFNPREYEKTKLAMLRSGVDGRLTASWQEGWIGGWQLKADDFRVGDFAGAGHWEDLIVCSSDA